MNILLLGSGGREHALAWKISQSPLCRQLYIAPGNGGTGQCGTNVNIGVNDFAALEQFVQEKAIDLVLVGPEDPLVHGVYDYFTAKGIAVIGPSKEAAQLEGSKAFSKKFMQRQGIPTAAYAEFTAENYEAGQAYLAQHSLPIVLKADGLAAGKGVVICTTHEEARDVFADMILNRQFGEASSRVVVEQFLSGIEISVFVLTDGKDYKIIGHAKDYKRIGEGDTGLNTGGMGCVSPVPFADAAFMQKVEDRIIRPTIGGLYAEGLVYKGFVFFGLINVGGEPYVIEYNCRMGDPETEVVMPRLKTDLVEMFVQLNKGELHAVQVDIDHRAAATVMAVSGGYPGDYEKGKAMTLPAALPANVMLFHAGTRLDDTGALLTNGGRVITATALAPTIQEAAASAKAVVEQVQFEGRYYRRDIGYEFE
ncbi:MAG: phosphoribosylamine--glycine ligase [Chitinophagaceae bacterium]|nr:phosphoribosylamine--glycine ligase [Chitinophagaceae bacterium]